MAKKEQTKQNIIDAFWHLYEVNRIEKITVKDICTRANINRSTFYEYFSSVFEVLETIENALIPNEQSLPILSYDNRPSEVDMMKQLTFFNHKRKYLKVLLSENGNPAFRYKVINSIRPMILALMKDKSKPENFEYILEYSLWGMIGVLEYHINNEEKIDEKAVLKTIMSLSEKLLI